MISSHARFGVGLIVGRRYPLALPLLTNSSKRFSALPTRAGNGYSDVQTARYWRRDPQITAGNVHNLSGGETWLG